MTGTALKKPANLNLNVQILLLLPLFAFLLLTTELQAATDKHQLHVRAGYYYGNYDGVISAKNSSFTTGDLEYEFLYSNTRSFYFRTTLSFDMQETIVRYWYSGVGQKFYFLSNAMQFEGYNVDTIIQSSPRWRFYYGWEAGFSHVVLRTIGELLQVTTSTYELGGSVGTIYSLTRNLGVEFMGTVQFSTGFTTVSTGAAVIRAMMGFTYYL